MPGEADPILVGRELAGGQTVLKNFAVPRRPTATVARLRMLDAIYVRAHFEPERFVEHFAGTDEAAKTWSPGVAPPSRRQGPAPVDDEFEAAKRQLAAS